MANKDAMINIGVSKEAVKEARTAIMDILNSRADQSTQVTALNVLSTLCEVNNTNITNCTFTNKNAN